MEAIIDFLKNGVAITFYGVLFIFGVITLYGIVRGIVRGIARGIIKKILKGRD